MSDLSKLLDDLDAARADATPGPWGKAWSNHLIDMDVHPDNAALIVAAVNALPRLTAALRAVEALQSYGGKYDEEVVELADLRSALAAALTPEDGAR